MRVRVRVPATSANLGPGFDTLGLALGLHNEIVGAEADGVHVAVEGHGAGELPGDERNVVARGVRLAYEAAGRPFRGVALACVNRIPPSRGLGSSAAAWVGGLVAGNALLGSPLDRRTLLRLATASEGHPDNVAAALLGGLTVSCAHDDEITALSLPVPAGLTWIVLMTEVKSATVEARAVLPSSVPRADAVFNVQRVSLLLASLQTGVAGALTVALDDRLHQPYRQRLFPWMPDVARAARAAGALGCVLSGAGPSLLAVVAAADNATAAGADNAISAGADAVARAMEEALAGAGIPGRARVLGVDTRGAHAMLEPDPCPAP
jgi:homoserine kinase